jgi:hypothetical protein
VQAVKRRKKGSESYTPVRVRQELVGTQLYTLFLQMGRSEMQETGVEIYLDKCAHLLSCQGFCGEIVAARHEAALDETSVECHKVFHLERKEKHHVG